MKKVPDNNSEANAYRVAYLVAAFIRNTLTDDERNELDEWVTDSDENMRLFSELTDEKNIKASLEKMDNIVKDKAWKDLLERSKQADGEALPSPTRWIYVVAASVALLIGAFFIYRYATSTKTPIANTKQTDLQPGGNKAVLTLSNGRQIILDSAKNGNLIWEGNVEVTKQDGQIVYTHDQQQTTNTTLYNTISTPNGGQYKIVLPDGSIVWLNAASSMTYPTTFTGNERKVDITGEAYFEIAKDARKKFIVSCKGLQTEVLGTHFNINTYDDEVTTKVTLLEGSVKVLSGQSSVIIKPGQQAQTAENGLLKIIPDPDTEEVTSWKEGVFHFKDATIEEIMRQVARWYDVKIVYEGKVNDHFNATIARNVAVSRLFTLLEKTGQVHFMITGKNIIVKP